MASAEQATNPNEEDVPPDQQVMSPRVATARREVDDGVNPALNGSHPPLRGEHDLDGETMLPSPQAGNPEVVTRNSAPAPSTTSTPDLAMRHEPASLSAGDLGSKAGSTGRPPALSGVGARPMDLGAEATGQPSGGGSVLSGVLRAVQTLPAAVEHLVARSGNGRTVPGQPGLPDSVEYASVRSSSDRPPPPPAEIPTPTTPLFEPRMLERMQRLQESAPLFYPGEAQMTPSPPRPPSTSSSDVQAEVRRQLLEMMAARDDESRRLRAQVEALSMENRSLRLQAESHVQSGMQPLRPEQSPKPGFPGLGWIGRGLGTLIGQPRPPRGLDLATAPPPPEQVPAPSALDFQVSAMHPRPAPGLPQHPEQRQLAIPKATVVPAPPYSLSPHQYGQGQLGVGPSVGQFPGQPFVPGGLERRDSGVGVQAGFGGTRVENAYQEAPEQGLAENLNAAQAPPPERVGGQAGEGPGLDPEDPRLNPLDVVLTGMAQLQSVVTELTSPKASGKPEVIKPGVTSLPDLSGHGPESSLAFADWLHASKPALADVSDTSEELWQRTVEEATIWYNSYLRLDPLSRLTTKPEASPELSQQKWTRVSRRIETMIISAAPKDVREEISASRTSGLLPLVSRLFVIYGPGTLMERELGLKHISEPPVGTTVAEVVETLRRWKRWCARMTELGGVLPDPSIQVRALTRATKTVLAQYPEVAFRINLIRASLQIDTTPDDAKVMKLHAQILAELEAMAHRGDKGKTNEKEPSSQALAKSRVWRRKHKLPLLLRPLRPLRARQSHLHHLSCLRAHRPRDRLAHSM